MFQGQGGAGGEYDYPEYPIYERSDTLDYSGGFLDDNYPTSVSQKGSQRSAQEDYQGYQTLGFGYKDHTSRRFLRRFGNLAAEKEKEEVEAVV